MGYICIILYLIILYIIIIVLSSIIIYIFNKGSIMNKIQVINILYRFQKKRKDKFIAIPLCFSVL